MQARIAAAQNALAASGRDQRRPGVSCGDAWRAGIVRGPGGRQRGADREAVSPPGRPGSSVLRRPQPAQWVPHVGSGVRRLDLEAQPGVKSLDTLRGYVRRVDLFKEHAGAAFP
jgi:hypothetical protein